MLKTLSPVFFLLSAFAVQAQQPAKADLEKQRAANHARIDEAKQSLVNTRRHKKASLYELDRVQQRLQLHGQQMNLINRNIHLIEGNINRGQIEITQLSKELDTLQAQYARSIVSSYENHNRYDALNFIFSAATFNETLRRLVYLDSYRAYRTEQAATMHHTKELLEQKITGLGYTREKKSQALGEERKQQAALEEDRRQKLSMVSSLKNREEELMKDLASKRKQDIMLGNAIAGAIRRAELETTTRKKPAALLVKTRGPDTKTAVAEAENKMKTLPDNFGPSKGSLPWPVAGNVSMHFGLQRYGNKGLIIDNPGITIAATADAPVKAVFDGLVSDVTAIGLVQAVIISHGMYYTAYSNLSSVSVTKGQYIKSGHVIGIVAEKKEGKGDIEFVISNGARNFDPEKWLR
ncbi:MAG TPA: peptidoglycan DD-metalloendopeptidase family protein [Chitinophagaceae bacterium]|nr:peptidoglycan DD-metalloendopeptidase family protein [Chitinophagaceae bacterium]